MISNIAVVERSAMLTCIPLYHSFGHVVKSVKERTLDIYAVTQIILSVWAIWKYLLEKCQKYNFVDVKNPGFPKYEASFFK